jgi:hypothetical protein
VGGNGLGGSASSNPNSFIFARIVLGDRHRKSATSSTDCRSLMHQIRSRVSLSLHGSVEYWDRLFIFACGRCVFTMSSTWRREGTEATK